MAEALTREELQKRVKEVEEQAAECDRAKRKVEHLAAVLKGIRNVNQLILRERDRRRLLQGVCSSLIETRGYQRAWIARVDEAGRAGTTAEAGLGERFSPLRERLKQGEWPVCARLALGKPGVVLMAPPRSGCIDCPLGEMYADRSAMAVRMEHDGRIYGLLCVYAPALYAAEAEEHALYREVAQDIAFALYNIERDEKQKRADEALQESVKRLSQVVEGNSVPTFVIDNNHVVTHCNRAFEKLTGKSADEIIGTREIWNVFFRARRPVMADLIVDGASEEEIAGHYGGRCRKSEVVEGGYEGESFLRGRNQWIFFTAAPLRNIAGKATGAIETLQDITERKRVEEALRTAHDELEQKVEKRTAELVTANEQLKLEIKEREQAEKKLRESEQRYRSLVETMNDGFSVMDENLSFTYVNQRLCQILGYSRNEMIGSDLIAFLDEANAVIMKDQLAKRRKGGQEAYELTWTHKDGRKIATIMSPKPILDVEGRFSGSFVVTTDITARKRAERALSRQASELERSNTELEQFAYAASHDLQEPLRMVSSFVQLLARRYEDKLDLDANEFIAYAVDGCNRMQGLINDLLKYSRLNTRKKTFDQVDCETVLDRTLANLHVAIEESGTVVTRDPLPTVMGDAGQLVQVFQNLISNAVKFRGRRRPRVHVRAERGAGEWRFSVQDNGIGIAPEYHERIFVIFQRLHGGFRYSGTGIGLALCKKIVERHGGYFRVVSEPGKGSTFYFTIPIKGGRRYDGNGKSH